MLLFSAQEVVCAAGWVPTSMPEWKCSACLGKALHSWTLEQHCSVKVITGGARANPVLDQLLGAVRVLPAEVFKHLSVS
jgi:hypothetical protein